MKTSGLPIGLVLAVACCASQADDLPPGVVNTQDTKDVSLTPMQSLKRIEVPKGYRVSLFAGEPDIRRPIAFDFDDRGRLWVVENYSHPRWADGDGQDRVVILEDSDHDGQFDRRTIFWDKGRYLTGIAVGHGGVWLANTPELTFLPDRNQDDRPDGPPVAVLDGFAISTNNVLNNFHWGPDGWLYGAIGLSTKSLVGKPGTPDTGRTRITRGIWRYHPLKKVFEKVAEGMVNPWGADFNEFGDLITANTVLAHLWHIVPGMYCERRAGERDNPFAYRRIQTIANHLHWGGGGWQSSRNPTSRKGARRESDHDHVHDDQYSQHSVAGGGHAHCGAMIYLGDNWPKELRGSFFTNNLHGNRVNNDRLQPQASSYVGVHAPDLFPANDPWFRGMNIKYGPDGSVYISDWHDFGECHDGDGSHRTSGRIYRFTYGQPSAGQFDLTRESSLELTGRLQHPNAWFARHAQRLLQERSTRGKLSSDVPKRIWQIFEESQSTEFRLRAMWTLYCTGHLDRRELDRLSRHQDLHVRRWAVRLMLDDLPCDMSRPIVVDRPVDESLIPALMRLADDDAPKVRLEVACGLQRLSFRQRLTVADVLTAHSEDELDPYLPLMIWYGIEPAVAAFPQLGVQLAASSRISTVREFIARRLVDQDVPQLELIVQLATELTSTAAVRDVLIGLNDGLSGKGQQSAPAGWSRLAARLDAIDDPELSAIEMKLATTFGSRKAINRVRSILSDERLSDEVRRNAFRTLIELSNVLTTSELHKLTSRNDAISLEAVRALQIRSNDETADILLHGFEKFDRDLRQAAVSVLVTRGRFASQLLDAIAAGDVDQSDVSAFALQQLRSFRDPEISKRVQKLWADDQQGLARAEQIARLKKLMTGDYLAAGDVQAGRRIFDRTCSKCHRLFGSGGTIAPDLTGSGRKKTDYIVRNLIDPSAEIDAAYRLTTVVTADGRVINGFIARQDDRWLTIRNQDAEFRLNMNDVDEVVTSDVSMMPEGMLKSISDEEFRNLLLYLRSEQQVEAY